MKNACERDGPPCAAATRPLTPLPSNTHLAHTEEMSSVKRLFSSKKQGNKSLRYTIPRHSTGTLGFYVTGGQESSRLPLIKLIPKSSVYRAPHLRDNDVLLTVHGISVTAAPLTFIQELLASGEQVVVDVARNISSEHHAFTFTLLLTFGRYNNRLLRRR